MLLTWHSFEDTLWSKQISHNQSIPTVYPPMGPSPVGLPHTMLYPITYLYAMCHPQSMNTRVYYTCRTCVVYLQYMYSMQNLWYFVCKWQIFPCKAYNKPSREYKLYFYCNFDMEMVLYVLLYNMHWIISQMWVLQYCMSTSAPQ